MKRIIVSIAVVILCLVGAREGLIFTFNKINNEAEVAIGSYAGVIQEYEKKNGNFPADISDFHVARPKVLYFIDPIEIQYTLGEQPELWYGQLPLGPLHVYNLATGDWSYAE